MGLSHTQQDAIEIQRLNTSRLLRSYVVGYEGRHKATTTAQ